MKYNPDFIKKHSADTSRYLAMLRQLTTEEGIAAIIWEASGLLEIEGNCVVANQKIIKTKHKPVEIDGFSIRRIKFLLKIFAGKYNIVLDQSNSDSSWFYSADEEAV
jgi:hypothetical protein